MNEALVVRRLLFGRPVQNLIAALVMALSVALSVCVLLLAAGMHNALIQAAEPFPMLMGAKGSPNQLVLNSVFLKDQPLGNISYEEVERLRADKNVELAVPLGFGDNYRGFRLVGTETEIFTFRGIGSKENWLKVKDGRAFGAEHEAVIGSDVAERCGLKIGDQFASVHGVVANANARAHKDEYTVVGILDKVHGPYDSAIFVSIESIWEQHAHGHDAKAIAEAHEHEGKEVTAVLIRPQGYAASMQLAASYAKNRDVQIIFPSKTVIQLFTVMGDVEKLLEFLSLAVLLLALLIIGSSLYWFVFSNIRQQAVLRALGATAAQVSRLYFCMGLALVGAGLIAGLILGHGLFELIGWLLEAKAGLYMGHPFLAMEGVLALAVIVCGAFSSWLPSSWCGRRDIAQGL